MKNFSVVYLLQAEEELVSLWENAEDRSAVALAANKADRELATQPLESSVYLGEDLWRLELAPLRFYFAMLEDDRIVEVSNVVLIPT